MRYISTEEWYALRVKSRFENLVEKALTSKKLSPIYLTYQIKSKRKDREKILTKAFFPGYIFLKTKLDAESHLEILKSVGVIKLIQNSQGPISIPEEQIQNILKLKDYAGEIIHSPDFACGMPVRVVDGPLAGVVGKVDRIESKFIKISIDSVPGSVGVHISRSLLEPIEKKHPIFA